MQAQGEDSQWRATNRDDPRPIAVAYHDGVCEPGTKLQVDEVGTAFICGFISCDLRPFNPLIRALPRLMHQSVSGVGAWVAPRLGQAASESHQRRPGSAALLEQVSEMVFIDAARRHLESLPEGSGSGWLAALRDRHLGHAIGLLHEQPAHS